MKRAWISIACTVFLLTAGSARAQEEEHGHAHGPDGRHVAVGASGAAAGKSILSHHDLQITDTSQPGDDGEGTVVEGAEVHSVIHKKGDPKAVIHRAHNAYEPENGVYGSHMMYREPGEYVLVENVTLPGGKQYSVEFPVWVPAPAAAPKPPGAPPLVWAAAGAGVLLLVAGAFALGKRSGRQTASRLSLLVVAAGLVPLSAVRAQEGEAGHTHGPDGGHAVAAPAGGEATPLRAYLGPNGETEATQTRNQYRFRLSIENEELGPADPDLVTLAPAAVRTIGLQTVLAARRPLAGGLAATGQVHPTPNGSVTVNARVAGRVVRTLVTPGQAVAPGQVVAVLDSAEISQSQAALTQAQSELREAQAAAARTRAEVRRMQAEASEAESGLDRVQAQRSEAQAEADRARTEVDVARGKADSARRTLARVQQLVATGAVSQGPVEAARSALAVAEGELREAQTAVINLEAQARRLEQGLRDGVAARRDLEAAQTAAAQGRTRVVTAERQLELARTALTREERIQRENLRDAREVQQAQADLDAAQLAIRSAEAGATRQQRAVEAAEALIAGQRRAVQSAQAQVESARSGVREAEAHVEGQRRAVRSALDHLQLLGARPGGGSQVNITAPLAGHVHSRPVNAGQVVAAGETLVTIVNTSSVWIESNVFEKDLPRVRVGQRVSIAADGIPNRTFDGTISYISHDVDPETRAVQVRTVVANAGEALKPNMFVQVIIAAGGGNAVTVPLEALQEQGGEQVVFVAEAEGAYRRRVVQIGPTLGDQVVVEAGVRAGERVVTQGAYQLLAKVRR